MQIKEDWYFNPQEEKTGQILTLALAGHGYLIMAWEPQEIRVQKDCLFETPLSLLAINPGLFC